MIVQPIILKNKVFQTYIFHYTTRKTRDRWDDNAIDSIEVGSEVISAKVRGSSTYSVNIKYTPSKIKHAICTCPFQEGPVCKHIVHVLIEADRILEEQHSENVEHHSSATLIQPESGTFQLEQFSWDDLDLPFLFRHSILLQPSFLGNIRFVEAIELNYNAGTFFNKRTANPSVVAVTQDSSNTLVVACNCREDKRKFCSHIVLTLWAIKERNEFRVYFDQRIDELLRQKEFKQLHLADTTENRALFEWGVDDFGSLMLVPKNKGLILYGPESKGKIIHQLLRVPKPTQLEKQQPNEMDFLVFGDYGYYSNLVIEWFRSGLTKQGTPKQPFGVRDVSGLLLHATSLEEARFYGAIAQFERSQMDGSDDERLLALHEIVRNPLKLRFYRHDGTGRDRIAPKTLHPIRIESAPIELSLQVDRKDGLFVITLQVSIQDKLLEINHLQLHFDFFLLERGIYYLLNDTSQVQLLNYFRRKHWILYVTQDQFDDFQVEILANLNKSININYSFVKPAPKQSNPSLEFNASPVVYISESDDFIQITPVIVYGEHEIPLLSNEISFYKHPTGEYVKIPRNEALEHESLSAFYDGMQGEGEELLGSIYISKNTLFNPTWFLPAFERWQQAGWEVLGFEKIKKWKYSPHRANVQVNIKSGINWFDTEVRILFGNQALSLKELQKAVRNRSQFVTLGNGEQGILPEEWLNKFERYFRYGELAGNVIRTSKLHFSMVEKIYAASEIDAELEQELATLKEKFTRFSEPQTTPIPTALNASLRPYQAVGFNWLCALDELGVGGCLADDMGLGKTIQVISFFLHLKANGRKHHLVVVPTSLVFNWQNELAKFAPSLVVHTHYGPNRKKDAALFDSADLVLTTYGMVASDIQFLQQQSFDYVVLDESQAIKNPSSQRFKSVRLLSAKHRIVMTGTPVENNTMDLYAQMTFVNPGLLGTWKQFKDLYATPIDQFNDIQRSEELQKRVQPFILRRTKKQVATELPEKTEMTLYCEMGEEQTKVYEAYRQEMVNYLNASAQTRAGINTMHMLAGMTKIRQICNSPALLAEEESYGLESAKIRVLLDELEAIQQDHKVIVFSQFVGMLELIQKELKRVRIPFVTLTGQTRNRKEVVEQFQSDPSVRVFLISLKAGGTGLNLTEADYVFLVDPWWNPAVENQAIDRVYRIGQTQKVIAVRMITPGTIEEKMLELQKRKRELAGELIQTDDEAVAKLTRDDFAFLLS